SDAKMTHASPQEQAPAARPYRGRYAPSPTGEMHLGHARTHLVAWLWAQARGGRLVMRFEDLDPQRVRPGSADSFLRGHEWLGLSWDEGPYYQSARAALYDDALGRLGAAGRLYPCTCSRAEIKARATEDSGEGGPAYPGTCRAGRSAPGRPEALRLLEPPPSPGFLDEVAGAVPPGTARGDCVVRRSDGGYAYHLAVVVDDID